MLRGMITFSGPVLLPVLFAVLLATVVCGYLVAKPIFFGIIGTLDVHELRGFHIISLLVVAGTVAWLVTLLFDIARPECLWNVTAFVPPLYFGGGYLFISNLYRRDELDDTQESLAVSALTSVTSLALVVMVAAWFLGRHVVGL